MSEEGEGKQEDLKLGMTREEEIRERNGKEAGKI